MSRFEARGSHEWQMIGNTCPLRITRKGDALAPIIETSAFNGNPGRSGTSAGRSNPGFPSPGAICLLSYPGRGADHAGRLLRELGRASHQTQPKTHFGCWEYPRRKRSTYPLNESGARVCDRLRTLRRSAVEEGRHRTCQHIDTTVRGCPTGPSIQSVGATHRRS